MGRPGRLNVGRVGGYFAMILCMKPSIGLGTANRPVHEVPSQSSRTSMATPPQGTWLDSTMAKQEGNHIVPREASDTSAHRILQASVPCVDDPTWDGGFGGCDTYAPGGINQGFCDMDGATQVCLLQCTNGTACAPWQVVDASHEECNNWQLIAHEDGWGDATMRIHAASVLQIENFGYADDRYLTDGVAQACLHPSRCYEITVDGPPTARWSIRDAFGIVVVEGSAPFAREVCHCGHYGGDACNDCMGVMQPSGGTLGDCNANGTLVHDHKCLLVCAEAAHTRPLSCFNGTIRTPSDCCATGTEWSGEHGVACEECPPGRADNDGNPSTPCTECLAGFYSNVRSATACLPCDSGAFSVAGASECTECPTGRYDDDRDPSTPCNHCPSGTISDVVGATECVACGTGTIASGSECTTCKRHMEVVRMFALDNGRDMSLSPESTDVYNGWSGFMSSGPFGDGMLDNREWTSVPWGGTFTCSMWVNRRDMSPTSVGWGGAIRIDATDPYTTTIENSAFVRNIASIGGAIHMNALSRATIVNSAFVGNEAYGGHGGAINIFSGGAHATIENSAFVGNSASRDGQHVYADNSAYVTIVSTGFVRAWLGDAQDHVYATNPTVFQVVNTTFVPFHPGAPSVHVNVLAGCEQYPCPTGFACSYSNYSLFCSACPEPLVGRDGLRCEPCGPGQGPNEDRTTCIDCVGQTYSTIGSCHDCDGIVDPDHRSCTACPRGQEADDTGLNCRCTDGNFNTSQKTQCYIADKRGAALPDVHCLSCDSYLSDCVDDCVGESLAIKPGWSVLARSDGTTSIFKCKHELGCTGTACNEGYSGPLCGVCDQGYSQDFDGECARCSETSAFGVAVMLALILFAVLIVINSDKYYESGATIKAVIDLVRELDLQALSKMLVATMQMITTFAKVLNISFPNAFQALIKALGVFRFDIPVMLQIGCLHHNSFFTSLAAHFSIVIVVGLLVGASYLFSLSRATTEHHLSKLYAEIDQDGEEITVGQVKAMAMELKLEASEDEIEDMFMDGSSNSARERVSFDELCAAFDANPGIRNVLEKTSQAELKGVATGRLFLLVFLLYPGLSNKVFEIFLCRDLGPNTSPGSILQADYGIDCDDTQIFRWVVGLTLVILWPIAVPVVLFASMFRVRAQILGRDDKVTNMYHFIISDYKLECWYWEIVELMRKLLLSGILSLVKRGSIAQAMLGTVIAFAFSVVHVKLEPYKSSTLNFAKTVAEIQLFVVLLTSVVLQQHNVGFGAEVITVDDYGMVQTVATVAIVPVILILIVHQIKGLRANHEGTQPQDCAIETANPLGQRDDMKV
eukprot:COSAG02_NODE_3721_length_6323_cov_3.825353_2_plen_1317_part_00